ncbi:hypothetical protein ABB37_07487 [Leptomonas pyrrhocoris]|uniref:Uncharacterized protein n=1 Tax=Leptomonas pyrrhocoris TaxID=157538 RepID=A0A0M9FV76_LEPPY|nr:hypothetical protein ABB37_07487 [Leptomonas pyrrhocoris]KPA76627.1 hypothetical protein ABB37_07487 [Leptomonas pyrrhocoris]|eukprot:XP_015655066.1 hypothetical protein ABB37_07487 [Leptomonas pyrrhocoris]
MSFVPPPPPGVVVPAPPAATPAPSAASTAVKVVKPGGVALDMSDVFGPPKTGAKKSLPPWELKKKSPSPGAAKHASDDSLNPPADVAARSSSPPVPGQTVWPSAKVAGKIVFKSTAERSYPSLSSLPTAGSGADAANAPAAATRKSLPNAFFTASPNRSSSPPLASVRASTVLPAATVTAAPAASLPHVTWLSTAGPVPAGADAVAQSTLASAAATGVPPQPGATATQPSPPQPSSDPAARAASARIVDEAVRDIRLHLATPSHPVVVPHLLFQGKEQVVVVPPLGPVPPKKKNEKAVTAKGKSSSVSSATTATAPGTWHNAYDLRPSPSCDPEYHRCYSCTTCAAGGRSTKPAWRRGYFQNVDVHRYIVRRYLGEPPPVEH